ncbi:MAG TPA: hypothetical protein VKR29_12245 [Candidatus Binataceae bacterium]|nr:hypothetical protein [Candidatus Binataceae bacterium]
MTKLMKAIMGGALAMSMAASGIASAAGNGSMLQVLPRTVASGVPVSSGLLGDSNPYGIQFVPQGFMNDHGMLQPNDVLVANYNNTTQMGDITVSTQGLGTTITHIRPNGQTSLFFNSTTAGVTGFTNALDIIPHGYVFAGTVPTTDGTSATVHAGPILIINGAGTEVGTIPVGNGTDPGNYGAWGSTINIVKSGDIQYFVANCLAPVPGSPGSFQGTIERYDISFNHKGMMEISEPIQIASGYTAGPNPNSIVTGPAGLAFDAKTDTLYVAGEGDDEIFAVPNASTATTDNGTGTVVYNDPAHLYGPLGLVLAPNGDLLTANADSINANPAFASQIVEFTPSAATTTAPAGTFVMSLQVDPANGGAFGLRLMENNGIAKLLAVDDNSVTLNAYNFALMQNPF